MSQFTHLHLHTEYSLLDGANKLKELAATLKDQGVSSVGMSDHGNMFGAVEFYKIMKKEGIKPIIGMETYIHNMDDIDDKSSKLRFHLCLFAKNEIGYKNLMYLSSQAFINGFYYNPRINKKMLKEHSKGLICSSACLQGEVNWQLNLSEKNVKQGAKGYAAALEVAKWYKELFGEDFYLEIMRHGIGDQRKIDDDIIRISKELDIKLIATNDTHYTFKERASAHEAFMCIAMGKILDDPNRLRHSVHEFYLKTPAQMSEIFADIPQAIENTQEIVDKCQLELKLGNPTPPNYKFSLDLAKKHALCLPEEAQISTANDDVVFDYMCREGLKERLKFIPKEKHALYEKRLDFEMNTIKTMKFSGYMLIVWDFIAYAKEKLIPVGPGRGSAAGSLVAFCLQITNIDPMPYNLLFERFLNSERVSMPDIDIDFCQDRRDEVIEYVCEKYGKTQVAQVATFGKLLAKGVIRDVARVCDMSIADADKLAKLIPDELKITLKQAYEKEPKIKEFISSHPKGQEVWDFALALEGLNRNSGVHAAGIVISNEPLWEKAPLFKNTKDKTARFYATQYSKDLLEDVDLIKFDFLGLKTLTVIENALKLIKQKHGKQIVWEECDINDPKVYELIQSGNTIGLFQIESSGMQALNARLKPECFEDLIAVLALYRPGPLESGMVDDYIEVKHGRKEASYAFDELRPILENTYGVIVYQEQVMQVVQTIGGFTLAQADNVRRAMGKKKKEILDEAKSQYLSGAKSLGFNEQKASALFDLILKFAEYGFNKSHSAAYAMITFQTAYLKTFYPAEFMAALLSSEEKNTNNIIKYVAEVKRLNFKLLPPDINNAYRSFTSLDLKDGQKGIMYGLGAIKGLGLPAIASIEANRPKEGFANLDELLKGLDSNYINRGGIEALIKAGCMDNFGYSRKAFHQNVEKISSFLSDMKKLKNTVRGGLFDEGDICDGVSFKMNDCDDYSMREKLEMEKEMLGIYLSGHPLDEYKDLLAKTPHFRSLKFEELAGKGEVLVLAKVEEIESKISKKGRSFKVIRLLDEDSSFEVLSFDEDNEVELNEFKAFVLSFDAGDDLSLFLKKTLSLEELKSEKIKVKRSFKGGKKEAYKEVQIKDYELSIDINKIDLDLIRSLHKKALLLRSEMGDGRLVLRVCKNEQSLVLKSKIRINESALKELFSFYESSLQGLV